jgi:hypothetical protein
VKWTRAKNIRPGHSPCAFGIRWVPLESCRRECTHARHLDSERYLDASKTGVWRSTEAIKRGECSIYQLPMLCRRALARQECPLLRPQRKT